jgi:Ni/Co efflux regulator RcnB
LLAQLAQPSPSERPTTAAAAAAAAAAATMTAAAPAAGGAGAEDEERRKRKRAADRTEEEWAAHHAEQDRRRGVLLGAIRDRGHAVRGPVVRGTFGLAGRIRVVAADQKMQEMNAEWCKACMHAAHRIAPPWQAALMAPMVAS